MADAVDRSVLAPATLVGRGEELSRFDRLLGETGSGAARVVEVAGDPGIGKTRLLVELAARAEMAGRVALYGRAAEFERHVPFGVVGAAIEDHLSGAGQGSLMALHPDDVGLLRDVFRSLPGDAAPARLIEAERYRLHRAVRALLESLAEPDGLVLILDDLHWADDGSGELLDHLLRRPPRGPILLALAHRPRQTRGRLRHALARAVQEGAAELIEVGPLSLADVRTLLPAGTTGREARQVYAASGGNPFYVQALVRAGARTTGPADSDGLPAADDAVPAHVWAALATELAALAPVETLVAQAAAVAGDGVEADLLAQTAGLELAEVLAALDDLVRRDVVRPIRATGRFQFRHPLLRSAAYETAGAGWRVAAHTRAAAALRDRGAPASQQARHVERSARPGDPQAIAVLYEAATATMHSTPATAAHWLRAALRLLPDDPAAMPVRLALTGMLAKALGVVGRLEESRDVLQEILRLIPRDPSDQRAKYVAFAALIERLLGRPAEARAILVNELSGLDDQDGPAALTLKVGLATGVVMRAERDAIRDWTAEALAAARRGPHRIILAGTLAMRVVGCHLTRSAGPTAAMLDEAAAIVDSLPDAAVAEGLDLVAWIGMGELCEERPDAAIRHFDRALRVARGTGQGHVVSYVHGLHGAAYAAIGDLATAAGCFDDALDAAMLTGSRRLRGAALEHQCYLAVWRGDLDEALRLGKEAFACAPDGDVLGTSTASGVLALAHLHAGDP
ncbi:MAG TPA: AAA family ATPase, partial [Pilimelia sp.]|nr:AAA family ATPase [Pilimelia sp.]